MRQMLQNTATSAFFLVAEHLLVGATFASLHHRITRCVRMLPVVYTNVRTTSCRQEKDGGRLDSRQWGLRRNLASPSCTFVLSEIRSCGFDFMIIWQLIWKDSRERNETHQDWTEGGLLFKEKSGISQLEFQSSYNITSASFTSDLINLVQWG